MKPCFTGHDNLMKRKTMTCSTPPLFRHTPVALAILAAGSLLGPTPGNAQAQTIQSARHYEIPAGPLDQALNRFAAEAGILLTIDASLTAGKQSTGLKGDTSPAAGLQKLLQGTGLEAVPGNNGWQLRRAPVPVSGETTLAPVTVSAQVERNGVTEGSGSYTATGPSTTATGLALTLRETPQSISVLTRQQIEDQNLTTLGEAAKYVTGISASSSDSDRTDLYSRGFYIDSYQYDGVPAAALNDFFGTSTIDPILYDRIEVVRGATGLLTGAGNPGASVNLIRKRASSKKFTGSASLGLGSWNDRRATVDISTPLTEGGRIRARVAAMAEERDSHLDRYHANNRALLATVEADLAPSTTLRIGWEHQSKRPDGVTWGGLPMVYTDGTATQWRRSFSIGTDWTYWDTTNDTVYAGLEHQFDNDWSLRAHVSRLESDYESKLLYLLRQPDSNGEGLGAYPNFSRQSITQDSANVQATGPFELLGQQHEAVVGLTNSESRYIYGNYAYTASAIGDIFQWDGSYPEPVWGDFRPLGDDRTRQSALYGALRLSLADSLKLIAGGRQSRWKMTGLTTVREHKQFTPYAGLIYDLDPVYTAYASYTDIFQPQDYRDTSGAYLAPVIGKNYEAGVKAAYLGGQLNTSLAVFRVEQDNVAVLDGDNLVAGTTTNAYRATKGATSKGFEVEVTGALTKGWQVASGFSRTIASDAAGERLYPRRSDNQWHLFNSYRLPGTWSESPPVH
ncbi:MAG: TonB-dependent siderophore receptor [Candidatus Dactylopiibacterium carminicum]|uniref:TonB-dependent siderophore receptor n=2 Tax=Candidatus Dactylopiibacterium carminicum TaxID=857335 RepID=A0A272EQ50_9RHOO|nr:TonB-dependent siderophore receptor [Candidatus Dactylopiibacterium carminicum]PAS91840.1 MAG: TonB-dependent siderophore receptor [Candidatus Dactylopiibacterium carminicum]